MEPGPKPKKHKPDTATAAAPAPGAGAGAGAAAAAAESDFDDDDDIWLYTNVEYTESKVWVATLYESEQPINLILPRGGIFKTLSDIPEWFNGEPTDEYLKLREVAIKYKHLKKVYERLKILKRSQDMLDEWDYTGEIRRKRDELLRVLKEYKTMKNTVNAEQRLASIKALDLVCEDLLSKVLAELEKVQSRGQRGSGNLSVKKKSKRRTYKRRASKRRTSKRRASKRRASKRRTSKRRSASRKRRISRRRTQRRRGQR